MRKFNAAIRVDPTYVRALVCRAEANQLLHSVSHIALIHIRFIVSIETTYFCTAFMFSSQTRESIVDYTRAIHLRPDVTEYRMARVRSLLSLFLPLMFHNKPSLVLYFIVSGLSFP